MVPVEIPLASLRVKGELNVLCWLDVTDPEEAFPVEEVAPALVHVVPVQRATRLPSVSVSPLAAFQVSVMFAFELPEFRSTSQYSTVLTAVNGAVREEVLV